MPNFFGGLFRSSGAVGSSSGTIGTASAAMGSTAPQPSQNQMQASQQHMLNRWSGELYMRPYGTSGVPGRVIDTESLYETPTYQVAPPPRRMPSVLESIQSLCQNLISMGGSISEMVVSDSTYKRLREELDRMRWRDPNEKTSNIIITTACGHVKITSESNKMKSSFNLDKYMEVVE